MLQLILPENIVVTDTTDVMVTTQIKQTKIDFKNLTLYEVYLKTQIFPKFPIFKHNNFNQKFLKMGVLSYPWARQDQKVVKKSGGGCFQKLEAK